MQGQSISLKGNLLYIEGKAIFIRSGSIHYWRIPQGLWEKEIELAKQANLNCIVSYVPWFWHEPKEGEFDFEGNTVPERNLVYFMKLLEKHGIYFIPRPGPFIGSELRYGGHPKWVFENYSEVVSKRSSGEDAFWIGQGTPAPSQLNSKFKKLVTKWYSKAIPVLASHTIEGRGCVILTQVDNEMNLVFTFGVEGSLFDPYVVGNDGKGGMWQQWLRTRYKNIDQINNAYMGKYETFSEIGPFFPTYPTSEFEYRRMLDWLKFKQQYVFDYAYFLGKLMRENGFKLPYTLNEPINHSWNWDSGEHGECSKYFKQKSQMCFTTGHTYLYGGEMDIYGLSAAISRIEMIKTSTLEGPPFSIEAGAGWAEYGERVKSDYNWGILLKNLVGHGLNGISIYMFSDGKNPEDSCIYGKHYSWNAPISSEGKVNPPYEITKGVYDFVQKWEGDILNTEKQFEVLIGIFSELSLLAKPFRYYGSKVDKMKLRFPIKGEKSDEQLFFEDIYRGVEELVKILTDLNINFEYIHLNNPKRKVKSILNKLLIVPNPGMIPSQAFKFIREFLDQGGKVLFYPLVPSRNPYFYEEKKLLDVLPLRVEQKIAEPGWECGGTLYHIVKSEKEDVPIDSDIYLFDIADLANDRTEIIAKYNGKCCGVRYRVEKGEVFVLGFIPKFTNQTSQFFFKELFLEKIGINRNCYSQDEILSVVCRKYTLSGNNTALLTVSNCKHISGGTKVCVNLQEEYLVFPTLSYIHLPEKSSLMLWVNISLKKTTIKYCTSELVPLDKQRKSFQIIGTNQAFNEIAFTSEVNLSLDGSPIPLIHIDNLWVGMYRPKREGSVLQIGY